MKHLFLQLFQSGQRASTSFAFRKSPGSATTSARRRTSVLFRLFLAVALVSFSMNAFADADVGEVQKKISVTAEDNGENTYILVKYPEYYSESGFDDGMFYVKIYVWDSSINNWRKLYYKGNNGSTKNDAGSSDPVWSDTDYFAYSTKTEADGDYTIRYVSICLNEKWTHEQREKMKVKLTGVWLVDGSYYDHTNDSKSWEYYPVSSSMSISSYKGCANKLVDKGDYEQEVNVAVGRRPSFTGKVWRSTGCFMFNQSAPEKSLTSIVAFASSSATGVYRYTGDVGNLLFGSSSKEVALSHNKDNGCYSCSYGVRGPDADDYEPYTLYPHVAAKYVGNGWFVVDDGDISTQTFNGYQYPTELTATQSNLLERNVTLTWKKKTGSNYSEEGSWYIYRKKDGGDWTQIQGPLSSGTTSASDTDSSLEPGATYTYRVFLKLDFQDDAYVTDPSKQPDKGYEESTPITLNNSVNFGTLTASQEDGKNPVNLEWKAQSGISVSVERKQAGGEWEQITENKTDSYTDTSVQPFTTYTYRLSYMLYGTEPIYSSELTYTTKATAAVRAFSATRGTQVGKVVVSWGSLFSEGVTATFKLSRREYGTTEYVVLEDDMDQTETSYTDNNALAGHYYEYKLETSVANREDLTPLLTDGYWLAEGSVAGHITYKSSPGIYVQGASVYVTPSDEQAASIVNRYSMRTDTYKPVMVWTPTSKNNYITDKMPFSLQMWVRPDAEYTAPEGTPGVVDEDSLTVSLVEGTEGNTTPEGAQALFDDNISTKWCVIRVSSTNQPYVIVDAGTPVRLTSYTFTTGDDNATFTGRNPKDWTILGSNDKSTWETVASVTGDTQMADANAVTYSYDVSTAERYQYYKLLITALSGTSSTTLGLAAWNLFGTQSEPVAPTGEQVLAELQNNLSLYLYDLQNDSIKLAVKSLNDDLTVEGEPLTISAQKFTNVAMAYALGNIILYAGEDTTFVTSTYTVTGDVKFKSDNSTYNKLSWGSNSAMDSPLRGYIDEMRFWTKALSLSDIRGNCYRYLGKKESNLRGYWPADEGCNDIPYVYDHSQNGDVRNDNNAVRYGTYQKVIPTDSQLSLRGVTDADGYYSVTSIPYDKDGTSYKITPRLGTHSFEASYEKRTFPDADGVKVDYSSVDFKDISSFKASVKVEYAHTNIPVDSCSILVNGIEQTVMDEKTGKSMLLYTDENGEADISIPIGDAIVSVSRSGHVFNVGRWPATGTKDVQANIAEQIQFSDSTQVKLVGRVVGGKSENDKPLGFANSQNNIGRVDIVLQPIDTKYRLNTLKVVEGSTYEVVSNTDTLSCTHENPLTHSHAYYGGGENVNRLYIQTDSLTGEFEVMVPPIQYQTSSLTYTADPTQDVSATKVNIDLRNAMVQNFDTLGTYSNKYYYNMAQRYMVTNQPILKVNQKGRAEGMYGEGVMHTAVYDPVLKTYETADVNVSDDSGNYVFGTPLFQQSTYTFNIEAYEDYVNLDNGKSSHQPIPKVALQIDNQLSDGRALFVNDTYLNGVQYSAGDAYPDNTELELDSLGKAVYQWKGGMPKTNAPYTRAINLSFVYGGKTYQWMPDGQNVGLKAILLGALNTGNNFVTQGPDVPMMILRDPPGTGSSSTFSAGTTFTSTTSYSCSASAELAHSSVIHAGITVITEQGGVSMLVQKKSAVKKDSQLDYTTTHEVGETTTVTYTETTQRDYSTSTDKKHVGPDGDVYIGRSTNHIIGDGKNLTLMKDDGDLKLGVVDCRVTNDQFTTEFVYSQRDILTVEIPLWQQSIRDNLSTVNQWTYNEYANGGLKNTSDKPIYLTTRKPTDSDYAQKGTYVQYLPESAPIGKVYNDTINFFNEQIAHWRGIIEQNESIKVAAAKNRDTYLYKNYSFDYGTTISDSYKTTNVFDAKAYYKFTYVATFKSEDGLDNNEFGNTYISSTKVVESATASEDINQSSSSAFTFKLADTDTDNKFTVDVFYAKDGFSPIFRTRGGQSSGPWEDEKRTLFYEPGKHVLMEGTARVDSCSIECDNPLVANVACGQPARFKVKLTNNSETNTAGYYTLSLNGTGNVNGAIVTMDGQPLASGYSIRLAAGQTVEKTVIVQQADMSALEYNDINLIFMGTSTNLAKQITLQARFTPSASPVELAIADRVVNTRTGTNLNLTFSGYDLTYLNQKSFRIDYLKPGGYEWTTYKTYLLNTEGAILDDHTVAMPTSDGKVMASVDMSAFPDGTYTFRIVSASTFGSGEITVPSNEIQVVKDTSRPQQLGNAEPTNGILNYGDDIAITFNEDINTGNIVKNTNFTVTDALNEAEVAHDVALKAMNTSEPAASTEADINLCNRSFATDMWLTFTGKGTFFSHGNGNEKFTVGADDAAHLVVTIGDKTYTSANTMRAGKWSYLAVSYTHTDDGGYLSASQSYDASDVNLFYGEPVVEYRGDGKVAVGKNMTGAISELSLWDTNKSILSLQSDMNHTKTPKQNNLIGYWKFNEGHGLSAEDLSIGRNMVLSQDKWYYNVENKAVVLDGKQYLNINNGSNRIEENDNFALELWFRAEATQSSDKAYVVNVGTQNIGIALNAAGNVVLESGDEVIGTSKNTYNDNAWHHVALNVLRGGYASLLLDGSVALQTSADNIATVTGSGAGIITIGAKKTLEASGIASYTYSNYLKGAVDEIRLWNATLNAAALTSMMYQRQDTTETAMEIYYPFEKEGLDESFMPVALTTSADLRSGGQRSIIAAEDIVYTDDAPNLSPSPQLTNLQFDLVSSERKMVITPSNVDAYRLENTTIKVKVKELEDMHGNLCQPIIWYAYVNQNQLVWADKIITVDALAGEEVTFTATIKNQGADKEKWAITGLPSCISAESETGTLTALDEQTVTFTATAPSIYGDNTYVIYLSGNQGINSPLSITLNVKSKDRPTWAVDPYQYEGNFSSFGQLCKQGEISQNENDMVAAFIDGECRGVGSPTYNKAYDAYFVSLMVYGDADDADKPVTFKIWDARNAKICPSVLTYRYGETAPCSLTYVETDAYGSPKAPFRWDTDDRIEENLDLANGWTWMSLYVKDTDETVASYLKSIANEGNYVKSRTAFAQYGSTGWTGSLETMTAGQLYKLKNSSGAAQTLTMVGNEVVQTETDITVKNGWNWIGVNASYVIPVGQAFASLTPEDGDYVKGQTQFATYDQGKWVGTLSTIYPGQGYCYKSQSTSEKTLRYPSKANVTGASAVKRHLGDTADAHFPFDGSAYYAYPENMTVIARVVDGDAIVADAEVAVFAGTELREVQRTDADGIAYLTIPGDEPTPLTLCIYADGIEYTVAGRIGFSCNDALGTVSQPVTLNIGSATGIDALAADRFAADGAYTTSGIKLSSQNGKLDTRGNRIIITKGQKVLRK